MLLVALWAGVGWAIGGVLAILAIALPAGRSPLAAVGGCPECETAPQGRLSLLWGRGGECESCGARRRERWPYVELAMAVALGALAARFGWGWPLLFYSTLAALLGLIVLIDLRHRLIFDVLTVPASVAALAVASFTVGLPRAALGGLAAGGVFALFYVLARLIYRRGGALGLGDVKLALLIGIALGAPAALSATIYSTLAGGLMAIGCIAAGRSRSYAMPYGPNLALGALAAILLDPSIWR